MLSGTCACLWGGSLCSQVCNSENGLLYFRRRSITRDEKGEQELLFYALLEHILKMTRKSVKVEEKGSEL